jgi:DnaJ-class molecular chaperone
MSALCKTCHGTGNILTFDNKPEWWPCPACGGAGSRIVYGVSQISINRKQTKFCRKDAALAGGRT